MSRFALLLPAVSALAVSSPAPSPGAGDPGSPWAVQVAALKSKLQSGDPRARQRAAESLGFLRAPEASPLLRATLRDAAAAVRREAALALAWCGERAAIPDLIERLRDEDRLVRQAAHVALTNLSGREIPFDGDAPARQRASAEEEWRRWWSSVPSGRAPADLIGKLVPLHQWATGGRAVEVSSTYRGPPEAILDGASEPAFWQTKNVPFPQWCRIDLGRAESIERVVIEQYGPAFVMTRWDVAVSLDGERYRVVAQGEGASAVRLEVTFQRQSARYVRITSHASRNPIYPTTFREVTIGSGPAGSPDREAEAWRIERALRALGVLGGAGADEAVCAALGMPPPRARILRPAVRAGIRALGRLRDERGFRFLLQLLEHPFWARYAADALGDRGDPRAVPPLLAAWERSAKRIDGRDPPDVPPDDHMTFPSEDRMLETPYRIILALGRLALTGPGVARELARLAPLLAANLPGDHDAMMLYEPEPHHLLTRYLLTLSGRRREAVEHAFGSLQSPPKPGAPVPEPGSWSRLPAYRMSTWLPALCEAPRDVPRLIALLEHPDGWVRINAAKALAWLGDPRAKEPIARLLRKAPPEASYGWSGRFKDEEFADPAPRWRQALVRALGILGAREDAGLIAAILEDEESVLEVRHAAAEALADLGNEEALEALERAARSHSFQSVRLVARDALAIRGRALEKVLGKPAMRRAAPRPARARERGATAEASPSGIPAFVFLRGSNDIPNTRGTVEQADRWRQTYVVTDSGPVYRPGRELWIWRPERPDRPEPLTRFGSGWVGEPEVSWDGGKILFTHRGEEDPWWHLWRIDAAGGGLVQLTRGPYHDVGPAWLPDGRIVFASSRSGIRDEYHGYPCTALWVMEPDGSGMRPIATNIGRDNEPALLADGRIAFSRLEVFYSRNKTELTLHAAHPDGTADAVLYGPERRAFWRSLDHGPRTPADGQEAPLTHRVLRMTQPRPTADGRSIVVVTQGGLAAIGPLRDTETILSPDNRRRSYTTPFPLPDGRILCASTLKVAERDRVNLGIWVLDPRRGTLAPVYDDPATADFEPCPLSPRPPPPVLARHAAADPYRGRFFCASAFVTRDPEVRRKGRLVRVIEGVPVVGRHSTQTDPWEVWKNHGGTLARVLGTVPLAADGSFFLEVPADRLLHLQVLDSDRRVIGNQLTWIYARPGETHSCAGCHEEPHLAPRPSVARAALGEPVPCLPTGDEFRYRAKAWFKGSLPAEIEERTRVVRAVNLFGR